MLYTRELLRSRLTFHFSLLHFPSFLSWEWLEQHVGLGPKLKPMAWRREGGPRPPSSTPGAHRPDWAAQMCAEQGK